MHCIRMQVCASPSRLHALSVNSARARLEESQFAHEQHALPVNATIDKYSGNLRSTQGSERAPGAAKRFGAKHELLMMWVV